MSPRAGQTQLQGMPGKSPMKLDTAQVVHMAGSSAIAKSVRRSTRQSSEENDVTGTCLVKCLGPTPKIFGNSRPSVFNDGILSAMRCLLTP